MKIKRSAGSIAFDCFNIALMLFVCAVTLFPLLNIFAISLSDPSYINAGSVTWFPRGWNFKGYEFVFKAKQLWRSYANTVMYVATGTLLVLSLTALMAYPLSIGNFVLKKFVTWFLAITMFISGGLIPTFLLIRDMHGINTFWVMVIPGCVTAWNVIIFRTFFQGIPADLRESAYMDGANDVVILFRIFLPLSKPLLATIGLFSIVGGWNSWFNALIYLTKPERYPVQMILRQILLVSDLWQSQLNTLGINNEMYLQMRDAVNAKNISMASVFVVMLPILVVYPFLQKHFAKGVMIGAIKG
jgi:putative aldouronate transport system permease protein